MAEFDRASGAIRWKTLKLLQDRIVYLIGHEGRKSFKERL